MLIITNCSIELNIISRNIVPDNIIRACIQTAYTERTETYSSVSTNTTLNLTEMEVLVTRSLQHRDGTNMMGAI